MVHWEEGVVSTALEFRGDFDPVDALRMTSVRYPGTAPSVLPLKHPLPPPTEPAPAAKRQKGSHAATPGGADEVQGAPRSSLLQLGETLLAKEGFAGSGSPYLQSVKLVHGRAVISGHFHCKIAGRYHTSNRQYFVVRQDGSVTQHCHHDGCSKQSVACPQAQVMPDWFAPPQQ